MKGFEISRFNNITFLFLLLLLANCMGKGKPTAPEKSTTKFQLEEIDGTYLFDGNTLNGWEITEFGPQGPVNVYDGKIIMNYGDGCTGVTYKNSFPNVKYEVNLEARKTVGNDFFCGITFPVQDEFCSLIVGGWGGPVVGLSCIDGVDASENETYILKRFDKDVWYKIKLQVNEKKIIAWVDNEKLVDFEYTDHEIYVRPEVELSKPFGICSWMTTAELRNIWLKEL